MQAATGLAPMARADLRDAVHAQVERSVAAGATVLAGCELPDHPCAYPASVLAGVEPGMPAWDEELFGPVASVIAVADDAEAVQVANATRFGLGASVWSEDRDRAERIGRQLQVGAVFINALVRSDVRMPFGGTKQSGYGRELAEHGIREFVNIRSMWVERRTHEAERGVRDAIRVAPGSRIRARKSTRLTHTDLFSSRMSVS